jgi:hypothetical protein
VLRNPLRSNSKTRRVDAAPPFVSTPERPFVVLEYLESAPIFARGTTGRQYRFSLREPIQTVDVRDATALLQTGFFRQTR